MARIASVAGLGLLVSGLAVACTPTGAGAPAAVPTTLSALATATTPTPQANATPAPTSGVPTPSATATPAAHAAVQGERLILRQGPGEDFTSLGAYAQGTPLSVLGRNRDGTWLRVQAPDSALGWMRSDLLLVNVSLADLPVTEPTTRPLSRTPRPLPTAPLPIASTPALRPTEAP